MIVKVRVKGQAILYRKHDTWNVVFITDHCHHLAFSDPGHSEEILAKQKFTRTILFSAADVDVSEPPTTGVVNEFLNLSLPIMHGIHGPGLSSLTEKPNPQGGRQYVQIKIPFGVLSVTKRNDVECFIERHGSGMPKSLGRPVASEFAITFDVSDPAGLTMTIFDDEIGADKRLYPTTADPLELIFNNDCDQEPMVNDFTNIYDWLYDISPPDGIHPKQFVAGKLKTLSLADSNIDESGNFRVRGRTGDCDPVIIDPPPGP